MGLLSQNQRSRKARLTTICLSSSYLSQPVVQNLINRVGRCDQIDVQSVLSPPERSKTLVYAVYAFFHQERRCERAAIAWREFLLPFRGWAEESLTVANLGHCEPESNMRAEAYKNNRARRSNEENETRLETRANKAIITVQRSTVS
jgi:hypothetical protein